MDHYQRLGLTRDADDRAVARAFRSAARDLHPDRGGDAEQFLAVEESYRVLSDPGRRRRYDQGLDGGAADWEDIGWGADVDAPPAETPSEADDVGWDDLGSSDDGSDGATRGRDGADSSGGAGGRRRSRLDPFVGGPLRLPDPLTPSAVVLPSVPPTEHEWVAAVGAWVFGALAVVLGLVGGGFEARPEAAGGTDDPAATVFGSLVMVAIALLLHATSPPRSTRAALAWVLSALGAVGCSAWPPDAEWTPLAALSVGSTWVALGLGILWARLFRGRQVDPVRLAALHRQSLQGRLDRHHRAHEWNRVRAALSEPGRTALLVGPAMTGRDGRLLPGRRWTFDPRSGAQAVHVVGDAVPQGSWVVVDEDGWVVAAAPAWSPESWLEVLQGA